MKPSVQVFTTYVHPDGRKLRFHPVKGVPGFTHRVSIDGIAMGWLGEHVKPSKLTAMFFFDEHALKKGAIKC